MKKQRILKPALQIQARLQDLADPQKARFLQGFFKTGPGDYAEGDRFLGICVPDLRRLVADYKTLTPEDVLPLLTSPIHEERLIALLVLVRIAAKGDELARRGICELYLAHTRYINNWDLVDCSAPQIVGGFLMDKSKKPLYELARSAWLWDRRIAILATFHFIRSGRMDDTFRIAAILLKDKEDLIHKAVGWMLREAGKRDLAAEEAFLKQHCRHMPRTMLRYAIEKFPEAKRKMYLLGTV